MALDRAARAVGGFADLANRLGLSRQAVYKWQDAGVPPERCSEIERITGVGRQLLRPDIFGEPQPRDRQHTSISKPPLACPQVVETLQVGASSIKVA